MVILYSKMFAWNWRFVFTLGLYMAGYLNLQDANIVVSLCGVHATLINAPHVVMMGGILYWLQALKKKQLVADGKLGKFGKILATTPASVREEFSTTAKKDAVAVAGVTVKKEPIQPADEETLLAVTTATPTAVALSAKKKDRKVGLCLINPPTSPSIVLLFVQRPVPSSSDSSDGGVVVKTEPVEVVPESTLSNGSDEKKKKKKKHKKHKQGSSAEVSDQLWEEGLNFT